MKKKDQVKKESTQVLNKEQIERAIYDRQNQDDYQDLRLLEKERCRR